MRKIFIYLVIALLSFPQTMADNIKSVSIGIVMPASEDCKPLNASHIDKLSTKVHRICTDNGFSSLYYPEGFVLYPVFELFDEEVVEGGVQKVYSLKFEFSLFVKQLNGAVLCSVTRTYKGAGISKEKAILNAISSINPKDAAYAGFMSESKNKIVEYYTMHTNQLIQKAENLSKRQQYEEALAILATIPPEVEQYPKVLDVSNGIYNEFLIQRSKEKILQAKGFIANMEYAQALEILISVNPASPMSSEAIALIESIETKIKVEEDKLWEFKMRQYKDEVELAKEKIVSETAYQNKMFDVITSIAKTYCEHLPAIEYKLLR